MECASVAAVGAAAAAAATAAGDGHEGDLGGEAGAYTNPYACMLTPEKIQALEAHKNSAVAKRLDSLRLGTFRHALLRLNSPCGNKTLKVTV